MTSQKLFQLEQQIATLLLNKLEYIQITPERASQIAKFTLEHLPANLTDEQVSKILPSLDDQYYELAEVVHSYLKAYEEANRDKVATEAQTLIHQGKIQEASKLMENYFSQKSL